MKIIKYRVVFIHPKDLIINAEVGTSNANHIDTSDDDRVYKALSNSRQLLCRRKTTAEQRM